MRQENAYNLFDKDERKGRWGGETEKKSEKGKTKKKKGRGENMKMEIHFPSYEYHV
jgi:hypothetical protein